MRAMTLAREYLAIELPVTPDGLKKAYRAASRRFHPDAGGEEASKEKFIQVKEAYDFLESLDGVPEVIMASESGNVSYHGLRTVEGSLLSELGLGLGPMKNGRECTSCSGRGYNSDSYPKYQDCPACHGTGGRQYVHRCRICRGSGRKFGGFCLTCDGKGTVRESFGDCHTCLGSGRGRREDVRVYKKCFKCGGAGETEVWNPVLPKGRLA